MYICKLEQRKYDDKINRVSELFRPAVINKTGDLSTENAKFLFFRRRSKELSLISLPINLEYMGKIIALANQKGDANGLDKYDSEVMAEMRAEGRSFGVENNPRREMPVYSIICLIMSLRQR